MSNHSASRRSQPSQLLLVVLLAVVGGTTLSAFTASGGWPSVHAQGQFSTEDQAQQHCPNDTVVWLNVPSRIYHFKDQRWYGATRLGAYVCQREADQAGNRATRNGE